MSRDLFEALNSSKFHNLELELEERIEDLFACRHQYPIWPYNSEGMDSFEVGFHAPIRHVYYDTVKLLIHLLRELRS